LFIDRLFIEFVNLKFVNSSYSLLNKDLQDFIWIRCMTQQHWYNINMYLKARNIRSVVHFETF